ncbi:hypothetical protein AKJ65_04555 [candidate division MSBL1 archaeon SCGC-AAA259E19]|uniref:Uncharacterized protein n=1 Tax=candidate division MSBL1 archaeon SCGC-AAA259E19 TaxID=1698264 RepID=A0A133UJM3_9EURY|nr:hypothetical protein AKJ65_04555 [candidate division MSBL1 archaeon SCGC-AAA259E19]
MSLEEFFVEEVGLSQRCWRDNEQDLRDTLERALRRYQDGPSYFGPPSEDGFLELIHSGPDYLGFLPMNL